jgi:heme A synthase
MKRNTMLKILNPFLFVLVINQATTAILSGVLPPLVFQIFHKATGGILLTLIALHFTLNFDWIKANYFAK